MSLHFHMELSNSYMGEFYCVVDQAVFSTTDHCFAVLLHCKHLICLRFAERLISEQNKVKCPICFQEYLPSAYIDRQETALQTGRLREREVHCESHEERAGQYFCGKEMRVYCEDCAHVGRECCRDSREVDFNIEIGYQIRVELERKLGCGEYISEEMKRLATYSGHISTAQDRYALLRKLLETSKALPLCRVHRLPVTTLQPHTLALSCAACPQLENCLDVTTSHRDIPHLLRTYLCSLHFYLLTKDLCKRLAELETLSVDQLLRTADSIARVGAERDLSGRKNAVFCPKCLQEVEELRKLPCAKATHVLCLQCANREYTATQLVTCPLDLNQFQCFPTKSIQFTNSASISPSLSLIDKPSLCPAKPSKQAISPEKPQSKPDLQGQSLPSPSLTGPCYKPLSRFSSVLPPASTDIPRSMQPWQVSQDSICIEAVSFQASALVRITGMTLGRPVQQNATVLLDEVFIVKGTKADGVSRVKLLNGTREIAGGGVCLDIPFDTTALCAADHFYTLRFRLRPSKAESVQLYRGNHYLTEAYLQSEGVEFWYFQEPEPSTEMCNGDHSRTGPVLRLYYR